ncbi:tetratricopeptide repeat protein, partial [Klebsiella pneumoniae]|nr:tetratricopeptide repeat protein [Klebsiella pneumoniae]
QLSDAEALFKRVLASNEKTLGPDSPEVADALFNLATIYWIQNRVGEVEPLLKRTMAIREKAFGPDHPAVAHALNNLALFY